MRKNDKILASILKNTRRGKKRNSKDEKVYIGQGVNPNDPKWKLETTINAKTYNPIRGRNDSASSMTQGGSVDNIYFENLSFRKKGKTPRFS